MAAWLAQQCLRGPIATPKVSRHYTIASLVNPSRHAKYRSGTVEDVRTGRLHGRVAMLAFIVIAALLAPTVVVPAKPVPPPTPDPPIFISEVAKAKL